MRCCYLAGPITGKTYDAATDWREDYIGRLDDLGWWGLSPMRAKEKFKMPGPLPSTFDEGKAAVHRDLHDIRRSEVVLVNLEGAERVSLGTMAEMGYAYAQELFILVVMPPAHWVPVRIRRNRGFAAVGEGGRIPHWSDATYTKEWQTNPHDHIFVHEMASQIVTSLDEALDVIVEL